MYPNNYFTDKTRIDDDIYHKPKYETLDEIYYKATVSALLVIFWALLYSTLFGLGLSSIWYIIYFLGLGYLPLINAVYCVKPYQALIMIALGSIMVFVTTLLLFG